MLTAVFRGFSKGPAGVGTPARAAPGHGDEMLDLKAVAQDYESFERRLARRGEGAVAALAPVRPLAARRRELNVLLEKQKKEQGEANARIRELAKGDKGAVEGARAQLRALGDEVKKTEQELAAVEAEIS